MVFTEHAGALATAASSQSDETNVRVNINPTGYQTATGNRQSSTGIQRAAECGSILCVALLCLPSQVAAQRPPPVTAFVNVNIVTMQDERVRPDQTLIVQGDRVARVGNRSEVELPAGAVVIDGNGGFLVPGLTDAHVHLPTGMPWAPTRDDFGDAPIYLSYGVTTVMNLSGTGRQLEWRRQIESGEWIGPTIYTAGPFLNEPRARTAEEVEADVVAQARQGFDLIKFHELFETTQGLSRDAYRRMIEAARRSGLPLVGHAPVNLGLDEMLAAHQSIAHVGILSNIHFMPFASNLPFLIATLGSFVVLVGLAASGIVQILFRRRNSKKLATATALTAFAAFAVALTYLPGGPWFDSTALRVVFTVLVAAVGVLSLIALWAAVGRVRDANASMTASLQAVTFATAAAVLTVALAAFWLPVSWRGSAMGVDRVARRVADAGLYVQSTLIVYESLSAEGRAALKADPVVDLVLPSTREVWLQARPSAGAAPLFRLRAFMQNVIAALHRHGVPIMAGTDAMGIYLIAPGSSLHRELQLLRESGLTPYEVLRSATVVPARFLGKSEDFGTIAPGRRADLLLVSGNPLQDLAVLAQPQGVMARGRWLPRGELDAMLRDLRSPN